MNTAKKSKICLLTTWLILFASVVSEAQMPTAQRKFIYQILVYHKNLPHPTVTTGFKPDKYNGIVTALHGFTANDITNIIAFPEVDDKDKHVIQYPEIDIESIDIKRDLVLLKCKKPLPEGGFTIPDKYEVKSYEELYVYGYPQTKQLQGELHTTLDPGQTPLGKMLEGTPMSSIMKARGSPGMKTSIIRLPPKAIQPGHSGGPVLNRQGNVVGVANGGFVVGRDREVGTMAVIPNAKLPDERYSEKALKKIFEDINQHPAIFLSSGTDSGPTDQAINPFNFPPSKPFLTFGTTLSRPFWFVNDGIRADLDFRNMNGRFDGYTEVSVGDRWAIGGYLSSSFLQYTILRSFDLAIPLRAEQVVRQEKPRFLYGAQASYIFSRGIIHNAYIGGGFLPALGSGEEARLQFNYRGFVGYRVYAGPRRKFGLEFRAMYVGQNIRQYRWQPTLGIPYPERVIHSLNQWYLCGGLTYSIYRRE